MLKKQTSDLEGWGWGWALRKRPAVYVLVLCKYYMSSTFAQLFAITSTGWVYYFRNHALFMEQHDLLPDSLSLSAEKKENLNWLSLLNNYKAEKPKWRCL